MKMYYWEDPAGLGWDIVVQSDSEIAAKSLAKEKIALETLHDDWVKIAEAIELSGPTGIFHYPAAVCIFTETDPVESRIARQVLSELSKQMRERASFGDNTASLTRLLETWADVLDGKPDVGWGARNREDLKCEKERSVWTKSKPKPR
jgi:hypothetical protein